MTDKCDTFRDCRTTIPLSFLKVSNLYVILSGFYGSSNVKNWMCELCKSSHISTLHLFLLAKMSLLQYTELCEKLNHHL